MKDRLDAMQAAFLKEARADDEFCRSKQYILYGALRVVKDGVLEAQLSHCLRFGSIKSCWLSRMDSMIARKSNLFARHDMHAFQYVSYNLLALLWTNECSPFERIISLRSNEDILDRNPPLNVHAGLLAGCSERLGRLILAATPAALHLKELRLDAPYDGIHLLARWLYGLPLFSGGTSHPRDEGLRMFLEAYATAEKLQIIRFMDLIADSILAIIERVDNLAIIEQVLPYLFKHSKPSSKLRKLFVDQIVIGKSKWNPVDGARFTAFTADADFAAMLVRAFMKRKSEQAVGLCCIGMPHKLNPCVYHRHSESRKPCYRISEVHKQIQEGEVPSARDYEGVTCNDWAAGA